MQVCHSYGCTGTFIPKSFLSFRLFHVSKELRILRWALQYGRNGTQSASPMWSVLHLDLKLCVLLSLDWNNKGRKTNAGTFTYTRAHKHTQLHTNKHTYTHREDFNFYKSDTETPRVTRYRLLDNSFSSITPFFIMSVV